jgi:hypothetical protein
MKDALIVHGVVGSLWCFLVVPHIWGWSGVPMDILIYTAGACSPFAVRAARDWFRQRA